MWDIGADTYIAVSSLRQAILRLAHSLRILLSLLPKQWRMRVRPPVQRPSVEGDEPIPPRQSLLQHHQPRYGRMYTDVYVRVGARHSHWRMSGF